MLRDIGVHSGAEIYNRKSRGTLAREGVHATRNPRYKSKVALRDQARQPLFGARIRRGSNAGHTNDASTDRFALQHYHSSLLSRSEWLPLGEGWYQASVSESGTSIKMGLHSVMDNQHSTSKAPLVILYQPRVRECFEACTSEMPFYDLEVSVKMLRPDRTESQKARDFGGAIPSSIFRTLTADGSDANNHNNNEKDIVTNAKIVFAFHSFSQYMFVIVNNMTQIWTLGYVYNGDEYILEEVYHDDIKLNTFYTVLIAIRGSYLSIDVNHIPLFTSIKVPEMMVGGLAGLPGLIARGGTKFAIKGWKLKGVGQGLPLGGNGKGRGGGTLENSREIDRTRKDEDQYSEYVFEKETEVEGEMFERREIDIDGDYEYGYGNDKVALSPIGGSYMAHEKDEDEEVREDDTSSFTYNSSRFGSDDLGREGPTSLLDFMNKKAPGPQPASSSPDEGTTGRNKGGGGNPMSLADMMAIKAQKREERERDGQVGNHRGITAAAGGGGRASPSLMPAPASGGRSKLDPSHFASKGQELYSHGGGGPGRLAKPPMMMGGQKNTGNAPQVRRTPFTGSQGSQGSSLGRAQSGNLRWGNDEDIAPNPREYLNHPSRHSASHGNSGRYKDDDDNTAQQDVAANNHERRVSAAYHDLTTNHDKTIVDTVLRDVVQHNPNISFNDIAALGQAKQLLSEAVVLPLVMPEFFTGIREPWKGVLLFGPPGTGKTLLAKAVCSLNESSFFNCPSSSLVNKFRGESEKIVRCLFEAARCLAPSVIFLDEVDALVGARGGEGEHEASRRFKTEMFSQMDGMGNESSSVNGNGDSSRVMVLATTNCPWDLDEAMRRRLEKRIYIPLPDITARKELYTLNLKNITLSNDVSVDQLASISEGYSGADIHIMCRDAAMMPMRRLLQQCDPTEIQSLRNRGDLAMSSVTMEDFRAALANTRPSVNLATCQRYSKWEEEFGSR